MSHSDSLYALCLLTNAEPCYSLVCVVVTKTLSAGESMLVDGDAILCFESSVTIEVEWVGNFMAVCCSGEGLFNTKMTGQYESRSLQCESFLLGSQLTFSSSHCCSRIIY